MSATDKTSVKPDSFCLPQDLSDIQWRVFREGVPAATVTMLLFIFLKRLV